MLTSLIRFISISCLDCIDKVKVEIFGSFFMYKPRKNGCPKQTNKLAVLAPTNFWTWNLSHIIIKCSDSHNSLKWFESSQTQRHTVFENHRKCTLRISKTRFARKVVE